MTEIQYKGNSYPIHFGLRAVNQFAKQTGSNFNDVVTASDAVSTLDALVSLGTLGLNEGAKRAGLEDRYSEEEIWEWCDEQPKLLLDIADIFIESIKPLTDKLDGLIPKV